MYLLHWPLLGYANLIMIEVPVWLRLGLLGLSIAASDLSYRLVEQPARRSRKLSSFVIAGGFAVCSSVLIAALSAATLKFDGFPRRFDDRTLLLVQDSVWTGGEYLVSNGEGVRIGATAFDRSTAFDFVVWGDSHACVLAEQLDACAKERGLSGLVIARAGHIPLPGLWSPARLDSRNDSGLSSEMIVNRILDYAPSELILVARWSVYTSGRSEPEIQSGEAAHELLVARQGVGGIPIPSQSATAVRDSLRQLGRRMKSAGITLKVVVQIPEALTLTPARDKVKLHRFPRLNAAVLLKRPILTRAMHDQRQRLANGAISASSDVGFGVVDWSPAFFRTDGTLIAPTRFSVHRDDDHITRTAADAILREQICGLLGDPT